MIRGRHRSSPATREQILDTTREVFDERGFRAASLHAVARTADVDPTLVHYCFDSGVQSHTQSAGIGISPERILTEVITPGRYGLSRRLMALLTDLWEPKIAQLIVESARGNLALARQYVGVIVEQWRRATGILGFPHGIVREESLVQAVAVVTGVVTSKYLLELEPVTSLTREQAVRVYGDLLQGVIDAATAAEDPETRERRRHGDEEGEEKKAARRKRIWARPPSSPEEGTKLARTFVFMDTAHNLDPVAEPCIA